MSFYQDDEFLCSFHIDLDSALNSLFSDANNVTVPEQRKQALKKETYGIECSLYFILRSLCSLYFILHSCYILLCSSYFSHTMFLMNTHLCLF
jgi:hypothetical protein